MTLTMLLLAINSLARRFAYPIIAAGGGWK